MVVLEPVVQAQLTSGAHLCAVPGCGTLIRGTCVLCYPHWTCLPPWLRTDLIARWHHLEWARVTYAGALSEAVRRAQETDAAVTCATTLVVPAVRSGQEE